ncbi:PulJ/GspJ family protein [Sulfurimonas sp. ST-27]|uniref:PulJ/GspJ family protein n=1 Tax=unclassified Sulfurimonas TaxID=2623549 RepID=UPI003AB3B689
MKKAFTLIEMMISITILSIMMVYLYRVNASVNKSNTFYEKQVNGFNSLSLKKRVLFLDLSLMLYQQNSIVHNDKNEDVLFLQTTHSLHRRVNPYVTYIVKNKKLYRLESLQKPVYPLSEADKFNADCLGSVDVFRVYKQKDKAVFLVNLKFEDSDRILMKARVLNEY